MRAGPSARRPSMTDVTSRPPCALPIAPVGQPAISARRRAPREHDWRACAAASRRRRRWRTGAAVHPRRCGLETTPAAERHRAPRGVRRRYHCAPRRTARRFPPAGIDAVSRASARSPTAPPYATCPSSPRHRPDAHRPAGPGRQSACHRRPVAPAPRDDWGPTTTAPARRHPRRPGGTTAATTAP